MSTRPWIRPIAGSLLFAGAMVAVAAGQGAPAPAGGAAPQPAAQKPVVKAIAAQPIVSIEGKDNYDAYCAVCHGREGKGNGPAAPAMKVPVPDLTTLASRHGGKFDLAQVEMAIRQPGKTATPAHGVEDMPIWGEVFRTEDRLRSTLRITNLARYVQSLQAPRTSSSR
jgi:mono/diheme cytochrome c family protein